MTGWKIDVVVLKQRPYSHAEFERRISTRLLGADVFVATAEDTILSKLEWASKSGSERQLQDVMSIVAVKGNTLDVAYIDGWAQSLGVQALWSSVRPQA